MGTRCTGIPHQSIDFSFTELRAEERVVRCCVEVVISGSEVEGSEQWEAITASPATACISGTCDLKPAAIQ